MLDRLVHYRSAFINDHAWIAPSGISKNPKNDQAKVTDKQSISDFGSRNPEKVYGAIHPVPGLSLRQHWQSLTLRIVKVYLSFCHIYQSCHTFVYCCEG